MYIFGDTYTQHMNIYTHVQLSQLKQNPEIQHQEPFPKVLLKYLQVMHGYYISAVLHTCSMSPIFQKRTVAQSTCICTCSNHGTYGKKKWLPRSLLIGQHDGNLFPRSDIKETTYSSRLQFPVYISRLKGKLPRCILCMHMT